MSCAGGHPINCHQSSSIIVNHCQSLLACFSNEPFPKSATQNCVQCGSRTLSQNSLKTDKKIYVLGGFTRNVEVYHVDNGSLSWFHKLLAWIGHRKQQGILMYYLQLSSIVKQL